MSFDHVFSIYSCAFFFLGECECMGGRKYCLKLRWQIIYRSILQSNVNRLNVITFFKFPGFFKLRMVVLIKFYLSIKIIVLVPPSYYSGGSMENFQVPIFDGFYVSRYEGSKN